MENVPITYLSPPPENDASQAVLLAVLPGPTRDREESVYQFRMVFRNPEPETDGCLALWHVMGGRATYQIALQRDIEGRLCWHCTCADHVYRHELDPEHWCKHVRVLQAFLPPMPAPTVAWAA